MFNYWMEMGVWTTEDIQKQAGEEMGMEVGRYEMG